MNGLAYEIKNTEKYDLIILSGEINSENHVSFLEEIDKLITYKKITVLDLKYLEYVDSSGIYALMIIVKQLKKNNLSLYAFNVHGKIKNIFNLVGLTEYLKIINKFPDNSGIK